MAPASEIRRVLITGLGLVLPQGAGVSAADAVFAGRSAVRRLPEIEGIPDATGAPVSCFTPPAGTERDDRAVQFAVAAAEEAWAAAGLPRGAREAARCASIISLSKGGWSRLAPGEYTGGIDAREPLAPGRPRCCRRRRRPAPRPLGAGVGPGHGMRLRRPRARLGRDAHPPRRRRHGRGGRGRGLASPDGPGVVPADGRAGAGRRRPRHVGPPVLGQPPGLCNRRRGGYAGA